MSATILDRRTPPYNELIRRTPIRTRAGRSLGVKVITLSQTGQSEEEVSSPTINPAPSRQSKARGEELSGQCILLSQRTNPRNGGGAYYDRSITTLLQSETSRGGAWMSVNLLSKRANPRKEGGAYLTIDPPPKRSYPPSTNQKTREEEL